MKRRVSRSTGWLCIKNYYKVLSGSWCLFYGIFKVDLQRDKIKCVRWERDFSRLFFLHLCSGLVDSVLPWKTRRMNGDFKGLVSLIPKKLSWLTWQGKRVFQRISFCLIALFWLRCLTKQLEIQESTFLSLTSKYKKKIPQYISAHIFFVFQGKNAFYIEHKPSSPTLITDHPCSPDLIRWFEYPMDYSWASS